MTQYILSRGAITRIVFTVEEAALLISQGFTLISETPLPPKPGEPPGVEVDPIFTAALPNLALKSELNTGIASVFSGLNGHDAANTAHNNIHGRAANIESMVGSLQSGKVNTSHLNDSAAHNTLFNTKQNNIPASTNGFLATHSGAAGSFGAPVNPLEFVTRTPPGSAHGSLPPGSFVDITVKPLDVVLIVTMFPQGNSTQNVSTCCFCLPFMGTVQRLDIFNFTASDIAITDEWNNHITAIRIKNNNSKLTARYRCHIFSGGGE